MTPAELATVRGRLEASAAEVLESLPGKDQRARGECYLRGLMLEGRRKSIEPMAARLGEVHYQALHHVVAVSPWDWRPVRRRLAEHLVGALEPTAWQWTTPASPKTATIRWGGSGSTLGRWARRPTASWGVGQRRHRGRLLPDRLAAGCAEGWDDDAMAERRAACHLPESVRHRPKWLLVLDMLDELAVWAWRRRCWSATVATGEVGEFRSGLDDRQIPYVVQVKADTSAYPQQLRPTVAPYAGRGRRPPPRYRDPRPRSSSSPSEPDSRPAWTSSGGEPARACNAPGSWPCGSARPGHPRRQAAARADGVGWELPVRWLLVEWPAGKPEPVKYWLSNLPATTPIVELVRLGKLRWRIEQDYRELKGALGLDHFEGRSWPGWHHHVTLVSVAHGFLTLERLRRPKRVASA